MEAALRSPFSVCAWLLYLLSLVLVPLTQSPVRVTLSAFATVTSAMAESTTSPSDELAVQPADEAQERGANAEELTVEITDIKASGLPAKIGFFRGLFYVRVKGGRVSQRTKTVKYIGGDDFVAKWDDTVTLSGIETSKVELEVYARRFFFSYKLIKKTESKESLADLLEHSETPIELELLEEGQAAGQLMFRISKSPGAARVEIPPATEGSPSPSSTPTPAPPASIPGSPRQEP